MTGNDMQHANVKRDQLESETFRRYDRIVRTFMTHDMKDEDILALATGREHVLARIIDAVVRSRNAAPAALQHIVLYGNRGFGKSFMTRRIQIEVEQRWPGMPYLLLPEEQHNLQRDPHAFLETIAFKLADLRIGTDTAYDDGHFRWPTGDERAERWQEAEAEIETALDAALPDGGIAIVVVENFDILLQRLFKEDMDEQRLRRWLDRPGNRLMLFATATGTVDMDYDRPLFQAFESVRLEPWSSEVCVEYFNRLRRHRGFEPLNSESEAKARAIAEFIGGTPRLAQLLGDVLETEDALEVAEIMSALADRLADYYRRRIEDLPPLSIGLLDALIRGGEPASQTELAVRVGAKGQSEIARVVGELQRADMVRGQPAPKSREKLYRVPDRVFVHYYRLRQGNRAAQETPLATILDFLRSFYSHEEQKKQAISHLEAGRVPEAGLFNRLASEETTWIHNTFTRQFLHALEAYLSVAPESFRASTGKVVSLFKDGKFEDAYQICASAEKSTITDAICAVVRAQCIYRLGHTKQANEKLHAARERMINDQIANFIIFEQILFLDASSDLTKAVQTSVQLESFETGLPEALEGRRIRHLAWRMIQTQQYEDALDLTDRAVTLARNSGDLLGQAKSLGHRTYSLGQLKRYAEALKVVDQAIALATEVNNEQELAELLHQKVYLLELMDQYEEAVTISDYAAELFTKTSDIHELTEVLYRKINSLNHLERYQEAIGVADYAGKIASDSGCMLEAADISRANAFALRNLGHYKASWTAAQSAVGIHKKYGSLFDLGQSVQECLEIATKIAQSDVVTLFKEWLQLKSSRNDTNLPNSLVEVQTLFAAVARADAWDALDAFLEESIPILAQSDNPIWFHKRIGEALAVLAAEKGRAAGYTAVSKTLPRIAKLMDSLPERAKDRSWLSDVITGFIETSSDPNLLRDIAKLITSEISAQSENVSQLIGVIADMDDTDDPEFALSRVDPDVATLARRLRSLPNLKPSPASEKRVAKR